MLALKSMAVFLNAFVLVRQLANVLLFGIEPELVPWFVFTCSVPLLNIFVSLNFGRPIPDGKFKSDLWTAVRYLALIGNFLGFLWAGGSLAVGGNSAHTVGYITPFMIVFLLSLVLAARFRTTTPAEPETSPGTPAPAPGLSAGTELFGDDVPEVHEVYTIMQIFLAGMLGGMPAGWWFLARNYRALGDREKESMALWGAFASLLVLPFLCAMVPYHALRLTTAIGLYIGISGTPRIFAMRQQGGAIRTALLAGAPRGATAEVVFVSLGWLIALFVITFAGAFIVLLLLHRFHINP